MNNAEFQLQGVGDPRLAVHATSALPAWLWSVDGSRIVWANPVGARLFGAANGAALAKKIFGPADSHRRQVVQLANRLPSTGAPRLERLNGFGAALGRLATCGCARLDFADGHHGILIAGAEPAARAMPLLERLQLLVEGLETPIAAFTRDGMLVGASDAARPLLGSRNLSEAGLEQARSDALKQGRVETSVGIGHTVLQRVGSGADIGFVVLITPAATRAAPISHAAPVLPQAAMIAPVAPSPPQPVAPPADRPFPDYEQPAMSGEAPAEFALINEFAELPAESPAGHIASDQPGEPSRAAAPPETATAAEDPAAAPNEPASIETPSQTDELSRNIGPLRFTWQMDGEGRFSLGSDEFTRLIGAHVAAGLGRPWREIAETSGLDPDGRVARAVATGSTWSGIILNWPVDGGGRLPVELSGLPIYDHAGRLAGYRGFGICRDLDGLARLAALRSHEFSSDAPPSTLSADIIQADIPQDADVEDAPAPDAPAVSEASPSTASESPASITVEPLQQTHLETPVLETSAEPPRNVLPFRPVGESKSPVLTPVENSAFNELARQLSARLDSENGAPATSDAPAATIDPPAAAETAAASAQPGWLAHPEPPARGESRRDRALLDLLPVGVLIYRLDRLLYANPAFLERIGYASLYALEEAGGLDALYVEPGVSTASSTSDTGTPVTISASQTSSEHTSSDQAPPSASDARLYTISWDGDSALALIFSGTPAQAAHVAAAIAAPVPASAPSAVGQANAEELGAILDTTAEGIVMFDAEGNLNSCNRSAEALFGHDGIELVKLNLAELFAPESQRVVRDYLDSTRGADITSLLDHGRDVLGQVRGGGLIPLSMTMGRTQAHGPNFFAVFRDLSQTKKSESELLQARRLADRAGNAKADMLARISHEVRTPLNAIIGFAEVMIGERFGALGNERYVEYMKDIRASGERVVAIINDLLDLSRIETGKLDLAFANQNLNDLVEQCVAVMQPQANRERIIIRTSLAHTLPPVVADARALRQITLNLIGNSIHLANAGGQVIVSTALSDFGEVVLRVRDTGHGLNDNEVAAAMEPFRTQPPSDKASDSAAVSLSLTKALVEANRAQFNIKTGAHSGTLIEVAFTHAVART